MKAMSELIRRAKQLARERGVRMAIVEYDRADSRALSVWTEAETLSDEFEAFDGHLLAVVTPEGEVDCG